MEELDFYRCYQCNKLRTRRWFGKRKGCSCGSIKLTEPGFRDGRPMFRSLTERLYVSCLHLRRHPRVALKLLIG
jgi:hypothetical protein